MIWTRIFPCGMDGMRASPSWLLRSSKVVRMALPSLTTECPCTKRTTTLAWSTGLPAWSLRTMLILVMGAAANALAARVASRTAEAMRVRRKRARLGILRLETPIGAAVVEWGGSACQTQPCGRATDSTGLNRGGEACRVPSSRKTIGNYNCRSEEHTSELQSRHYLVRRLLLEKKKTHHALAERRDGGLLLRPTLIRCLHP